MSTKDRKNTKAVMEILNITSHRNFELLMEYLSPLAESIATEPKPINEEQLVYTDCRRPPSEREIHLYNINALATHFEFIRDTWRHQLYPSLKAVDSPVASKLYDRFTDGSVFLISIKRAAEAQLLPGEEARIS